MKIELEKELNIAPNIRDFWFKISPNAEDVKKAVVKFKRKKC